MTPQQHQEYERRGKRSRRWELTVGVALVVGLAGAVWAAWSLS